MKEHEAETLKQIEEIAEAIRADVMSKKPHPSDIVSSTLFRGHACAGWPLETTLERFGLANLELPEYVRYLSKVKPAIESVFEKAFSFQCNNPEEKFDAFPVSRLKFLEGQYKFMVYLRHHGFPTPLLDWSRSLYVALFFALSGESSETSSALYIYVHDVGRGKGGVVGDPEISTMPQYVAAHKRHWTQQSEYTACVAQKNGLWQYYSHVSAFAEGSFKGYRLERILIKPALRVPLLRQLDSMNVNAFSLFNTEEALLKTLAFREMLDGGV